MDKPVFKKKRHSSLLSGSEVLQSLFEKGNFPLAEQFKRWKLWAQWEDFVGPSVAKNTEPVGYLNGVLYVWVKNSTWMQQLVFMRDHIKEAINRKLNQNYARSIRFTLDRRDVPQMNNQEFQEMVQKVIPFSEDEN